jgi:glycosyltransferase involved in cell wall biosynthesis
MKDSISIVVPVYGCSLALGELYKRVKETITKMDLDFELILVNDASPDNSWEVITEIANHDSKVIGIKLSRNFGQHKAITAGLNHSKGDYIVLMDCDLQDKPEDILIMYNSLKENNSDIVFTERNERNQQQYRKMISFLYFKLFAFFSDVRYSQSNGSLVMFSSKVKSNFLKINDVDRAYLPILKWLGFSYSIVRVEHDKRFSGKSSYSFRKLLSIAIQSWTSYSEKLLNYSIITGFIFSIIALLYAIFIIYKYLHSSVQPGWTSLIVLILLSTGIILISIGIVGLYVGKTFEQSKNRPLYIIDKTLNYE